MRAKFVRECTGAQKKRKLFVSVAVFFLTWRRKEKKDALRGQATVLSSGRPTRSFGKSTLVTELFLSNQTLDQRMRWSARPLPTYDQMVLRRYWWGIGIPPKSPEI